MFITNFIKSKQAISTSILVMLFSTICNADYMPYPGKIPVKLVTVESANIVVIGFDTYPGYYRKFRITLPGIEVPSVSASICETALATRAKEFTRTFVTESKKLRVHDMVMQTSADDDASAHLFTAKGSLADALVNEKLARLSTSSTSGPWCKD